MEVTAEHREFDEHVRMVRELCDVSEERAQDLLLSHDGMHLFH